MTKEEIKEIIAKRAAGELHDGNVVNLGIGIPTMVPQYISPDVHITLQAENGLIGCAEVTDENKDEKYVIDAGGGPAAISAEGCYTDSFNSFGLMRGGHLDATILGSLEVDEEGNLANWIIPGKRIFGMGGAMDLVIGAKKVIIAMEHTNHGAPKILKKCSLPFTAVHCVDLIITEMGVMRVTVDGLVLEEINPAFTVEDVQRATEARLIVSPNLKNMET